MKNVLVIGSLNIDFVVNVPTLPLPGETLTTMDYSIIPGGKGANQAYALGKLGSSVSMIGAVGNDVYGKILTDNLKSVGVNTKRIIKIKGVNTGNAFITVDKNGENSIVVASGANKRITKELIDQNIDMIKKSDVVVMQLEIPVEVVNYVAKIAKLLGKAVVLDPAPAIKDIPDELFKNVDIMKPNETELQTITGLSIETDDDILKAAKSLVLKGVKNVIVTLGAKGSILVNENGFQKFNALKVEAVDTTAAGDCFTAGLVRGLITGKNIDDAIRYGHVVSSIAVTKKGAQSSVPSYGEVNEYIKKGNL